MTPIIDTETEQIDTVGPVTRGRVIAAMLDAAHITIEQAAPVLGLEDEDLRVMLDGYGTVNDDEAARLYALIDLVSTSGK